MSNPVIQLSVEVGPSPVATELLAPISRATIEFFDSFQPSANTQISFTALEGLPSRELNAGKVLGLGDFHCISQSCISDANVFESSATLASVDPGLLASSNMAGMMNHMNDQTSFQSLNSDLLNVLPRVQDALAGDLAYAELSQLIADIQAQVLDLNTLSQDLFGDLSDDVNETAVSAGNLDTDSLLASMQIDSGLFAQPELSVGSHSLAFQATLDGLFTSPEAFPLTLDFSNASGVQEASELFASTGNTSSISSTASNSDVDSGLPGNGSGSSDLT